MFCYVLTNPCEGEAFFYANVQVNILGLLFTASKSEVDAATTPRLYAICNI